MWCGLIKQCNPGNGKWNTVGRRKGEASGARARGWPTRPTPPPWRPPRPDRECSCTVDDRPSCLQKKWKRYELIRISGIRFPLGQTIYPINGFHCISDIEFSRPQRHLHTQFKCHLLIMKKITRRCTRTRGGGQQCIGDSAMYSRLGIQGHLATNARTS